MEPPNPGPSDFIGCILTITTKPSLLDGRPKNLVGTVRCIDTKRQAITLDDVTINGTQVSDGYVIESSMIQDLAVCGKTEMNAEGAGDMSGISVIEPAFSSTPKKKPLQKTHQIITEQTPPREEIRKDPFKEVLGVSLGFQNVKPPASSSSQQHHQHVLGSPIVKTIVPTENSIQQQPGIFSSAFVKTEKGNSEARSSSFFGINPECGGPMGKGPTPTKPSTTQLLKMQNPPKTPNGKVVYTASEIEQKYFKQQGKTPVSSAGLMESIVAQFSLSLKSNTSASEEQNVGHGTTPKDKLPVSLDQKNHHSATLGKTASDYDNPLYKLFASQFAQSTVVNPIKKVEDASNKNLVHSSGNTPQTSQTAGLTILKRPHTGPGPVPQGVVNHTQHNMNPRQTQKAPAASAFEMTNDEIKAEEFDFEENLAMFEKLPSAKKAPKPVVNKVKEPQFGKSDTTYTAERTVSSIKLMNDKPDKYFVTDTGILVPAVPLRTRSKILNLAHNCGLTHGRMVEIMGRAVAQTAIPLLGDSYRLSPERTEDRPSVLVIAGPHWNGAVAISAARTLATQGIRTSVLIWNYELPLIAKELRLYRMTKQPVITDMKDIRGKNFDLVILGGNDHQDAALNVIPFARWLVGMPIILVDPPLLKSYRKPFDFENPKEVHQNGASGNRISIVSPCLPLAYPTDTTVKIHLVNLGIPQEMFEGNDVKYVSPFGDKLILQLFATKQDISSASS